MKTTLIKKKICMITSNKRIQEELTVDESCKEDDDTSVKMKSELLREQDKRKKEKGVEIRYVLEEVAIQ